MARAGIKGLPGNRRPRCRHEAPTAPDLAKRMFTREVPNRLWVNDISEHRTYEGKVHCAVVSIRSPGESSGGRSTCTRPRPSHQRAVDGDRQSRSVGPASLVHSDHGAQSPLLGLHGPREAVRAGPVDGLNRATATTTEDRIILGRMQTELLNRKRWKARIELANAIFDYLEIFHNSQRRHSALGMRIPIEFELLHQSAQPVA